jgi:hypothetical protein
MKKKTKSPFSPNNSGKHLHIQHLQLNSLNINAKLVMVEVAPPHFHPTPKMSRRFFKTSPRFVLNTVTFFLKDRGLS